VCTGCHGAALVELDPFQYTCKRQPNLAEACGRQLSRTYIQTVQLPFNFVVFIRPVRAYQK
jgi:hypothetical protein